MNALSHADFEAVIGLEVHCQLSTESKIFCSCPARHLGGVSVGDLKPNAHTCPVCTAQPGALPVLNKKVVEYAIRAGLALGCTIRPRNVFARKNYFYPDLPKGYQISQYEAPICENGVLAIGVEGRAEPKPVRIIRIHMEEDAGKTVHGTGQSLVNLNRAGVPLIEIVSAPELSTPLEAGAYLRSLYGVVTALGICDGNLQEGNFRCDANVSVRPKGSEKLGTRAEIKNVNSFRFVEKAIEYEINRQINVIISGGRIVQETRTYDSDRNLTQSMRSKEEAEDYRYFPDPDLIPLKLDPAWIEQIRATLPELPEQRKARFVRDFGLSAYDAGELTSSAFLSDFFERTLAQTGPGGAKSAANLLLGEVSRLMKESGSETTAGKLTPRHLAELVSLLKEQAVSSTAAKQVLGAAWASGEAVGVIVEREGLKQVSDTGALDPVIDKVIAGAPKQVAEFKAGKEKILGYFVGQVMKETGGKANPALLQEMIRKKLSS